MKQTLTVTGYVGGSCSTVQQLLESALADYVAYPARSANGRIELDAPDSPLNRAALTTVAVGPEAARLTEVTLRLAQPFHDSTKSVQMLDAARLIGDTTRRLTERLAAAA